MSPTGVMLGCDQSLLDVPAELRDRVTADRGWAVVQGHGRDVELGVLRVQVDGGVGAALVPGGEHRIEKLDVLLRHRPPSISGCHG
jgi:hypothetical protein